MKRYRTTFLKFTALLCFSFPLTYLIVAKVLFQVPGYLLVRLLLSPTFYILSGLVVAAGWGIWEMRRWSWYVLSFATFFCVYESAIIATNYAETDRRLYSFLAMTFFVLVVYWRATRDLRVPYFLPRIRWWESSAAHQVSVPITLARQTGERYQGEILDVSSAGCFVRILQDLDQDETLSLEFNLFGQLVECEGVIVWRTHSTVTTPKGVGIKFGRMKKGDRAKLKASTQRLYRLSELYRQTLDDAE